MIVDNSGSILATMGGEVGEYVAGRIRDKYQNAGRQTGEAVGKRVNNLLEYLPVVGNGIRTLNQDFLNVLSSRNQSLREGFDKLEKYCTYTTNKRFAIINKYK